MDDQTRKRLGMGLALGTLWFVWGSTYLAVSWVLPAAPPFVLSAARFAVAGPLLALAATAVGAERPTLAQARSAAIVGILLFLGGNGGTVYSQTRLPSSISAVLVGLVPLWLVILSALVEGDRPHPRRLAGVLTGLAGVAGLVGGIGGARLDPVGVASVVVASLSWAGGSILARRLPMPSSVAWSAALQMMAGAVALGAASLATGQAWATHLDKVDGRAVACFAWLVVGGSLAALMAYNWLLRVTSPAVATTYAYVNPLVAVWLGWWLGGESLSVPQLACSAAIVGAVVLVTTAPPSRRPEEPVLARRAA